MQIELTPQEKNLIILSLERRAEAIFNVVQNLIDLEIKDVEIYENEVKNLYKIVEKLKNIKQ